jgi:dUTP pyrophosphatase
MLTLKIKKLFIDSKLPSYAHPGDAGLDVFSREDHILPPGERHAFGLGFAVELPEGYVALVWDKSSLTYQAGIHCLAGVIDAGYRGEYVVILHNSGREPYDIKIGDKIAQILIQPVEHARIVESSDISNTARADGKYGSSGR